MTETAQVRPLFAEKQPVEADDVTPAFVDTARAVAAILGTRLLLLIAVCTGAAIWSYTIFDPERERLYAAVAFSLVFVLPQVFLHWKRG